MMVSVSQDVFLFLPLPKLCLGTVLFGSSLAAAKSLTMFAFPLPLRSHMNFISIFSCLHARMRAFSSLPVYSPDILIKLQIFKASLLKLPLLILLSSNLLWFLLALLCIFKTAISHKNPQIFELLWCKELL